MNIQELEEQQYNMGRATDQQNAYALSQMERKLDDPRIADELAKGKFIVVEQCEQYCPFTDASLPPYMYFLSAWDNREDAERVAQDWTHGNDRDIGVVPFKMPEIVRTEPTDEVPF